MVNPPTKKLGQEDTITEDHQIAIELIQQDLAQDGLAYGYDISDGFVVPDHTPASFSEEEIQNLSARTGRRRRRLRRDNSLSEESDEDI